MKKGLKISIIIFVSVVIVGVLSVFIINGYVKSFGNARIVSLEEAKEIQNADCIIVLGCQVRENGTLSDMLRDRVKMGVELYKNEAAPKILMSGDHGREEYNEVGAMKRFAMENEIPSEDVFMDHAGFSTYETMYRAKEIFKAQKVIIVTQKYHLYRAVYIAEKLGLEANGVSSDYRVYFGQNYREGREILARCKDFVTSIFKPKPTFLGDAIPINGSGDITND